MKYFYVYIMASKRNGTLYIGMTSNLPKRVTQHRQKVAEGFTNKYDVHKLVWYERHEEARSAIEKEKQLKRWKRIWKLRLIEETNPEWNDLYKGILL